MISGSVELLAQVILCSKHMDAKLLAGSFSLGSVGSLIRSEAVRRSPEALTAIGSCVVERAVLGAYWKVATGFVFGTLCGALIYRYAAGSSDHIIPAELPPEVNEALQAMALQAHSSLGLRDLSRSDFIVAPDNSIVLLETNTLPGMTPTSLYPDGANAYGLSFGELMQALVRSALDRGRPSTHGRTSAAGIS